MNGSANHARDSITGLHVVMWKEEKSFLRKEVRLMIIIIVNDSGPEITDQGEYGKMTPRPAAEYWKERALKYRETARNFGEALGEERDKNAALRGKLLQIIRAAGGKP